MNIINIVFINILNYSLQVIKKFEIKSLDEKN